MHLGTPNHELIPSHEPVRPDLLVLGSADAAPGQPAMPYRSAAALKGLSTLRRTINKTGWHSRVT